jgi:hypothetical protein
VYGLGNRIFRSFLLLPYHLFSFYSPVPWYGLGNRIFQPFILLPHLLALLLFCYSMVWFYGFGNLLFRPFLLLFSYSMVWVYGLGIRLFRPFLLLPHLLVLPLFSCSMIRVSLSHVPAFCTCPFSWPHCLSSFADVAFNGMRDL